MFAQPKPQSLYPIGLAGIALLLLLITMSTKPTLPTRQQLNLPNDPTAVQTTHSPPLLFTTDNHGRYHTTTAHKQLTFTPSALHITLLGQNGTSHAQLNLRYLDAAPHNWQPVGQPTAVEHRYIGHTQQTDIPLYDTLRHANLYPGIDLIISSADGQLKSDFHLAPHANPSQIAFVYDGAEQVWLDEAGQLHIATTAGTLTEEAPIAWQEIDGQRQPVPITFALDGHTVRFELGDYDPTHPLTIDPILTYFRPTTHSAITSDDEGNLYIAEGAFQVITNDFGQIIYVRGGLMRFTKLTETGQVAYRTTVGGRNAEYFGDMVLDDQARLFFSARTTSPDFPVTANAADQSCGTDGNCNSDNILDRSDAVVGRLGFDGKLEYAMFWGGPFSEFEQEIALDQNGRVYLGGFIETPNNCSPNCDYSFPTTPGVLGPSAGDPIYNTTAFLMALDMSKPPAQAVQYSTLVRLANQVDDLAADSTGRALLQNGTAVYIISPTADQITDTLALPGDTVNRIYLTSNDKLYSVGDTSTSGLATSGAPDTTLGGSVDAYVARQDLDGNLEFFTYIGGSSVDYGRHLALRGNKLFVAGFTFSTNFPTINPLDTAVTNNEADLFLNGYTLNSSGSGATLNWATYLGGDENERLYGLAPYSDNEVWLAAEALDDTFWPRKGLFISRINGQHGLNLHVSHTVAQNPVPLGQTMAFTTTVANYGSKDAQNVVVTGTLPSNTYWDITLSTLPLGDCVLDNTAHTYACAFASLPKGKVYQLFFSGPTKQYGTVTHTAEISGLATDGTEDVVPEDDTATAVVNIRTGLGIGVTAPREHTSGDPLTVTLTITNYGPDPMTDVTFSQAVVGQGNLLGSPVPRDPITPPCILNGTPITSVDCAFANPIPAGTTYIFDAPITTTTTARGTLTHTVSIDGKSSVTNANDLDPSDNSDQALTELTPPGADVAVHIKDVEGTAGEPLTFTLTITNFGGEIADSVKITTTFGTPTTTFALVSAAVPANPACTYSQPTGQPATHTCAFGNDPLYPNTTRTVQFVVVPLDMGPLPQFGRPVIKATSTVTATAVTLDDNGVATPTGNGDPDTSNNDTERFIGIDAGYDLEVSAETSTDPQPFQEPFTLTAKLINSGVETARAVTFTVGIPISLTYNSHTASTADFSCAYATAPRQLACTAPEQQPFVRSTQDFRVTLNLTAVQTGTIDLNLEASAAGGYSDYLNQDTGNGEQDPSNNSGTFTVNVEQDAKLSLTAFQLPADGRVGTDDLITHTVRLKNDGPNTAENISFTLIWSPVGENPVPTQFPSFCNLLGDNVLECSPPNLARGETSPTYQFVSRAPATITNTPTQVKMTMLANATASQRPAKAEFFTKILRKAQLEIDLDDSNDPAPTSQPYTITVNVHNLSTHPSTVTTATLTAVGYNFDAATLRSKPNFCTVSNGFQMVCAVGSLGDNQFKEFGIGLNAPTESGSRTILGRVSSSTLMPLKPSAREDTLFRPERRVSVSMTAVPSSTVKPNERLTLNVRLENVSDDPATKLELTFRGDYPVQDVTLPGGVTCAPTTVSIAPNLPAFKCNLPDLAGKTTAVYSFQLTVPRAAKESLTHYANLEIFEINRASNSDVRVSFIDKEVDLAITKLTDTPDPVGKGEAIQYEAKIHNNSNITATNVVVTLAVPDAVIISASSTVSCQINSAATIATCTFPQLPPFTSQELTFRATVPANTTKDKISAGLDVQGAERDPAQGNNGKAIDTAVEEQYDLNFTSAQVSGAPAPSGQIVFVDIAVRNSANGTAENVLVKPTLTPNLELVKLWHVENTATNTACPQTGCQLGNLAQNESKTLRVVVRVIGTINDGDTGTVTLTAVAENSGEKTPADNSQATTFDLTNDADMSATLATADGQPLTAGKNGTLRLTLNNAGPADAKNVVATITLPQDLTALSTADGNCTIASGQTVTCSFPAFQKGQEWADFTVKADASLIASDTRQVNYAITSQSDPNSGNDNGAGTINFKTEVDLSITGQALPEKLDAQDTAVAAWVITNLGPSDAQSYQVNFKYSGEALDITAVDDPTCTINDGGFTTTVTCNINDALGAGEAGKTIKLTVRATGDGFATIEGTTSHPDDRQTSNNITHVDFEVEDKANLAVAFQSFTIAPHYVHNAYATLLNTGPETARDASLKISLPNGLEVYTISGFSGAGAGTACTTNGQLLECNVKGLPSGSTFRVNFTVNVVGGVAQTFVGQITTQHNNAQIDPHLPSNSADIIFYAQGPR